jgi:hypothetical protein
MWKGGGGEILLSKASVVVYENQTEFFKKYI